ncbi:MAG: hypothetical protein WCG60_00535 [bacterium]
MVRSIAMIETNRETYLLVVHSVEISSYRLNAQGTSGKEDANISN